MLPAGFNESSEDEINNFDYESSATKNVMKTVQNMKIKIVPDVGYQSALNNGNFDVTLENDLKIWFEGLKNSFKTYKKSQYISNTLKQFYQKCPNPFLYALKLFANSTEFANPKMNTLTYIIFEELLNYKKTNNLKVTDNNLKMVAFNFAMKKRIQDNVYQLISNTYEFKESKDIFTEKIRELINEKYYKDVAQVACDLQLYTEYTIHDFLIPLLLQDKVSVAENYLNKAEHYRLPVIKLIDSFIEYSSESVGRVYIAQHNIPEVNVEKIHRKPLSKLISRLLKTFKLPNEIAPNFVRRNKFGALQYLINKKYVDSSLSEESFEEMIKDTIPSDMLELQLELIDRCTHFNDIKGAAKWCTYYNIEESNRPTLVNDHFNNVKNGEVEENWDEPSDLKDSSFHSLQPNIAITLVDDATKFVDMINVLKTETLIAIDSEWKPTFTAVDEVALIQMAASNKIYLIDINVLQLSDNDWKKFGTNILNNEEILKLGFSLATDLNMIQKSLPAISFTSNTQKTSFLDLQIMWRDVKKNVNFKFPYQMVDDSSMSLSNLVNLCIGKKLDKSNQFSNWTNRPLRQEQIVYAALDAYCLLEIYDIMKAEFERLHLDFEELQSNLLNDNKIRIKRKNNKKEFKTKKNNEDVVPQKLIPKPEIEFNGPNKQHHVNVKEMKFVCDTMFEGLARVLRRCGIDTLSLKNEEKHERCIEIAEKENRYIITRDHIYNKLMKFVQPGHCMRITKDSSEDQLLEVITYYRINVRPEDIFSRCTLCNCAEFTFVNNNHIKALLTNNFTPQLLDDNYDAVEKKMKELSKSRSCTMKKATKTTFTTRKTSRDVSIRLNEVATEILQKLEYMYICEGCGKCYWDGHHLTSIMELNQNELPFIDAVHETAEYVEPKSERGKPKRVAMDDRDSIYLDTISIASDNNYRKSLSLSRQTIYHSAEDVTESQSPNRSSAGNSNGRWSAFKEETDGHQHIIENGDIQSITRSNNSSSNHYKTNNLPSGIKKYTSSNKNGGDNSAMLSYYDEVTTLLLNDNDKNKSSLNMNITSYSQWKSRTWRRFQDGERVVDYVLAYQGDDDNQLNSFKRECFQRNLESEGLELEIESTQRIHFVKIHATKDVLSRYCDIMRMKMPIRDDIEDKDACVQPENVKILEQVKTVVFKPFESSVVLDRNLFPEQKFQLLYEYSRDKSYLFDVDSPDFFTESIRIAVVHFILERQRFTDDEDNLNCVGIQKLLSDGVYRAAYPLHNGNSELEGSQRYLLLKNWASVSKWIRHQPLDAIKDYFGVRIAIYFAWLGFYTHMLIPASIVGLICFTYGIVTMPLNQISNDICNDNTTIMCPRCDTCDYWYLNETCIFSRISNIFDNNLTVAFAFFMSFWATLYLELWKRYSANIQHRWGMTDFTHQTEHPRPEYIARLTRSKRTKPQINVVTQQVELNVPYWKVKFPTYVFSYSVVLSFMFLAVGSVIGVIIFRMSTSTSKNIWGTSDSTSYKIMIMPVTAAIINLVVCTILNFIYGYLAIWLNDLEFKRSQTEYDESLTIKIYLFQFINYYSSIFYIAFVKGKFIGYPMKYNKIFGLRQEECNPGGCLMELCIQLTIIMVGKQAVNALMENISPYAWKTFYILISKIGLKDKKITDDGDLDGDGDGGAGESLVCCNQWTEDYKSLAWSQNGLFDEYLEMIIQYGFITIFVVAFPLAPLFALINNIFEMRLDAKKFLIYYRRSVPTRVRDIGVWYNIMHVIGRIAVISSAFIIAFSSNFIPRMVYHFVSHQNSDRGFLNHTLSYFNTSYPNFSHSEESKFENVEICRYSEYRNPPSDDPSVAYKRPALYWHVMTARLAFVVVFQNIVGLSQVLVAWAIPDRPRHLRDQIKRENYLTSNIIIKQEKKRLSSTNRMESETSEGLRRRTDDKNISKFNIEEPYGNGRRNHLYANGGRIDEEFITVEQDGTTAL